MGSINTSSWHDSIGDQRNSVYAWTLKVWERKGRMGSAKHSSEKGRGKLSPVPSHYCVLPFPSSLFSLKPLEFKHKLKFFGPLFGSLSLAIRLGPRSHHMQYELQQIHQILGVTEWSMSFAKIRALLFVDLKQDPYCTSCYVPSIAEYWRSMCVLIFKAMT